MDHYPLFILTLVCKLMQIFTNDIDRTKANEIPFQYETLYVKLIYGNLRL